MGYPTVSELNVLDPKAFADEVAPLFEGARGFLERLAAARPFESDHAMMAAAREVARTMPEPEQIELLDAHPILGADPESVSPASFEEQGYGSSDEAGSQPMLEELAMLNDVYQGRFGFRFVVFVNRRPKSEIVPILEQRLERTREEELNTGVGELVAIAEDRWRRS